MAGRFSVETIFKAVDRVTAPISRMQSRVSRFTRGMARGLRTANRQVDRLLSSMGRGVMRIAKFGGALASAAGAATILALNRAADAADALAKQSRRLQFPIEELQEWKFVAEQSGIANSLLDSSLAAFTKRLGEAKAGIGPLVSGLKNVNPSLLQQLQNTESVADAFAIYIDAIREAETATEKAALANAAFSRAGLQLVNIADNSSDAIAAMREEQRQNGVITMQQAEAAEAYNDAINSLKKSIVGLLQGALLPMTPAITENLRQLREWIVSNRELIQSKVAEYFTMMRDRLKQFVMAVIEFNRRYNIGEMIENSLDALFRFGEFMSKNGPLVAKVAATILTLIVALKVLAAVMAIVNIVMLANPIGLIVVAIAALIAAVAAAIIWWDDLKAMFESLPGPVQAVISALMGPIWLLIYAGSKLMEAWGPVSAFFSSLLDGVAAAFDEKFGRILEIIEKVKRGWSAAGKFFSGVSGGIASAFGFGGEDSEASPQQMVSPQERVARSVEESRTTSTAEVTLKDETGRAEVTRGRMGGGVTLQRTGGF